MVVVAAYLRRRGIQIYLYLDDWLVKGSSKAQVQRDITILQATCGSLGLLVNHEKAMLVPVQRIELIGAMLDTTWVRVCLPLEMFRALMDLIVDVSMFPLTTASVPAPARPHGNLHICGLPFQTPHTATAAMAGVDLFPIQGPPGKDRNHPSGHSHLAAVVD